MLTNSKKKALEKKIPIYFFKLIIFFPLLIYLGERSPIAHDEGFYILQAKWIIQKANWIAPMWWGNISLDRTNGIQSLIAISRKFFGESGIATYLPITFGSVLMLLITYYLHKQLIDKKFPLISSLILSTTYLWLNYSHMATQDIIFSSLIAVGIFSSIGSLKTKQSIYFLISGIWIGLAFMLKTYLTIIPIIAILPFLKSSRILFNKYFWFGTFLGFLPFLFWSYQIISAYGYENYEGLYNKLITLSTNNNFTNPIYYYLWNLPVNIFPWFIFSLVGFIKSYNSKSILTKYFLFKYPLIVIVLISLFSTKTPYYPLQLMPLISINTYLGIMYILSKKNKLVFVIKTILFLLIPFTLLIALIYLNSNSTLNVFDNYQKIFLNLGLIVFILSWTSILFLKNLNKRIILILIGPYFLFSTIVQSGLLNDRTKELRIACKELIKNESLLYKKVDVINNEIKDAESNTKIIKIAIFMPEVPKGVESIEKLNTNEYAWTTLSKESVDENIKYSIINDDQIFSPWKLILKN